MTNENLLLVSERLVALLKAVAWDVRRCRFCGRMLYFVHITATGKTVPYTAEGLNHFVDCPYFERKPDPRQQKLVETDETSAFEPER